ncbi:hypothetical protein R5R35_013917 [Gryllus longicercus]|uniref:Uncharacterized protein n=1 Tax=Gryllus longicercus TaxID=2509291 RepID=A0AAN9VPP4_9ORTH
MFMPMDLDALYIEAVACNRIMYKYTTSYVKCTYHKLVPCHQVQLNFHMCYKEDCKQDVASTTTESSTTYKLPMTSRCSYC